MSLSRWRNERRGRGDEPMVMRVTPSSSDRIAVWMRVSVAKSTLAVASSRRYTFDRRTRPR